MENRMFIKIEDITFEDISVRSLFVDKKYDKTEVEVKWDGCCNIKLHSNYSTATTPIPNEINYFHICELKEFIDMLTEVYERALEKGYEV